MSDHRCHLKIEFSIYGKDFDWDTSINYRPDDLFGIDSRVLEFFVDTYAQARAGYESDNEREDKRRAAEKLERDERSELTRLKAKYEPLTDGQVIPWRPNPLLPQTDPPEPPEPSALGPNWTTAYDRDDWGRMGDMDGTGVRWRNPTAYEGEPHSLTGPWGRFNVDDRSSIRWMDPTPVGDFSATGITCRLCGCKVPMKPGDVIQRGDPRLCEHLGGPPMVRKFGFGMKAGESTPGDIATFTVAEPECTCAPGTARTSCPVHGIHTVDEQSEPEDEAAQGHRERGDYP